MYWFQNSPSGFDGGTICGWLVVGWYAGDGPGLHSMPSCNLTVYYGSHGPFF